MFKGEVTSTILGRPHPRQATIFKVSRRSFRWLFDVFHPLLAIFADNPAVILRLIEKLIPLNPCKMKDVQTRIGQQFRNGGFLTPAANQSGTRLRMDPELPISNSI